MRPWLILRLRLLQLMPKQLRPRWQTLKLLPWIPPLRLRSIPPLRLWLTPLLKWPWILPLRLWLTPLLKWLWILLLNSWSILRPKRPLILPLLILRCDPCGAGFVLAPSTT